ncbi:MAG: glycosyltransferase family 2 protein [Hyphomicrobiaceae bacterium]
MSNGPYVSVVIPLYQTQRYIAQALASVLAQTFTKFEVLVIDDGSSDGGPAIARAVRDPRIRVITQQNRGLAGARNTGIAEALGEVIAFLDADDLWQPTKLERHVAHLLANPAIGVSFAASRFIDDDGAPIGLIQKPTGNRFEAPDIFCRNPVGNGSAPVIRRATLDAIAFYDPRFERICWFDESFRQSEDIECWTRIAATTPWRFGYLDAPLTDYRVNTTGLSANTTKQLETWQRFRAKVESYAPALAASHGDRAQAYQLRYLARRAVRGNAANSPAFAMMWQALRLHPRLVVEEPARTLVTLAASLAQQLLPQTLFERGSAWAIAQATRVSGLRV